MRCRLIVGLICASMAAASDAPAGPSRMAAPPSHDQYQPNRVQICHRTTSRPVDFVSITIRRASLPGHLKHGDTVGPCLYGSVRGEGRVALQTSTGRVVTVLEARRLYSIVVRDRSRVANFHLFGRGVDRRTGVAFVGTIRLRIAFQRGEYRYQSDRHSSLGRRVSAR